jgi:hypothetical protein
VSQNIPSMPIPKVHHRWDMEPMERVESFADQAEALLDRLAESPDDGRIGILCVSLAAAYVEGAQDGYGRGYEPPGQP